MLDLFPWALDGNGFEGAEDVGHARRCSALNVALLAREPAAMAQIRAETGLSAVPAEEPLGHVSWPRPVARTCLQEGEASGVAVAPGQRVGLYHGWVNRDGAAFEAPAALGGIGRMEILDALPDPEHDPQHVPSLRFEGLVGRAEGVPGGGG